MTLLQETDTASARPVRIASPRFGPEEEAAVLEVMRSGVLAQGPKVEAFERAFAEAVGAGYAVATSNGSTALQLMLTAHGIGPGDEVITSAETFIATANAVALVGAQPVFVDVDATLNLDPEAVEAAITPRTRAILAVHLHGNPADLFQLREIAARHRLLLLQDACQAIGATLRGRPMGGFGSAAYSLYATKNLTTGEGGMIVTNDPDVALACRRLRHQAYGDAAYVHQAIGHNFRMTELQAAIGLVQLSRLEAITEARRRRAAWFDAQLDADRFPRPFAVSGARSAYHQYTIRFPGGRTARDRAQAELARAGIGSAVYYPLPLHQQPPYQGSGASCPEAERAAGDMLSIPVHPEVSDEDAERVVQVLQPR